MGKTVIVKKNHLLTELKVEYRSSENLETHNEIIKKSNHSCLIIIVDM